MNVPIVSWITGLVVISMVMVVLWMIYMKGQPKRPTAVIEPFTRQFFNQIIRTHFVGIDQAQLFGNEFQLIETLAKFMPFHLNTVMIDHSIDRYRQLNNNGVQLVVSRSIEIYNLIYKITPLFAGVDISQIRFVCALFGLPVNVLTTQIKLKEFGDLKGSGVTLNVGPKDSVDYFVAVDLLLRYQLTVGVDVFLTYYDANELVKHYGRDVQVAILTRTHPDVTILSLVNTKLTRLIEIQKYNNGNLYHISLEEEGFYKDYPYYSKSLILKENLQAYYPNLVINIEVHDSTTSKTYQNRFINTIKLKYYLLSNAQTDRSVISQLLYNMKLNTNELNRLPFIDAAISTYSLPNFTLPLETHQGASDFYEATGLYTNIDNPSCVMINGRCDMRQLTEHHLGGTYGSPHSPPPLN